MKQSTKLYLHKFLFITCKSVISHKLLPDNLCSQHNEMFMEIIFRYFNDQHFLTAVELPDVFDQRMDVLRCFGANSIRPIDLFNTLNMKFGAKVDTSSVSSFPTTHGFYANVRNETSLFKLFEKVASFNPRTKLMVSVEEISSDLVKESLTVGYKKFKLLNIALLTSIARRIDKEDFDHEIVLCQYNPFTDDRNNLEYPMHHCLDFTPKNMKENLIQMEDFQKLRLGNLRGFPLRISLFEYEMKSVAVYDEYGRITHYIYPDGELVTVLAKYMNFTPAYLPEIGNGLKYGFQSPSGIFEGALGDSEYDRADLLANPKLIADYNTTNSVFLRPTAMTKLYFIIKKRITYKKTIFLINRIETFLVTGRKKCVFGRNTLYIFQLLNNISSRHSNLNASRITAALVFFYALVTTALFQGSLIQKLNLNQNAGSLNKIEELFENNFTIAMAPILSFVFTVQGTDRVTKRIMEASNGDVTEIVMRSDDAMEELAYNEKLAFLWIEEATGTFLNRFYDNLTGENLFERVPESAFEFYIAMMLPKSSPFIDRFNHFINIYVEAGLYQYHVKKAAEDNEKVWIQRIREGKVPKQNSRTLEMDDLKIAFKLYLFFVVAATIAFFFECLLSFASKRLKCRKFRRCKDKI
ncbi:CLUMA_CG001691, isoform A [Clunio marinus]|uniref:CLUMA_CG001691, isoform A n=1 Tax=Clunio marinus TaxID=568069 RepID=A0A1J1HIM7_9DIPT|nr:CLUMA_CG001691, isoform A [Clunio marinus]